MEIKYVLDNFADPLTKLFQQTSQRASEQANNPEQIKGLNSNKKVGLNNSFEKILDGKMLGRKNFGSLKFSVKRILGPKKSAEKILGRKKFDRKNFRSKKI